MVRVIPWMILFCASFVVFIYAYDRPSLPRGGTCDLKLPAVSDLRSSATLYDANNYVNEVILPAKEFFVLNSHYSDDDGANSFFFVILSVLPFYFIWYELKMLSSGWLATFFYFIVCLLFCLGTAFLASRIYNRFFGLPVFRYSEADLRKSFLNHKERFPISERDSFNNYVVLEYRWYYLCINKRVSRRITVAKALNIPLTIFYLICAFLFNLSP